MLYTLYTGGLVPVFGVSVCVRGGGGWTASMPNPMYEGGGEYTLLAQVGLT